MEIFTIGFTQSTAERFFGRIKAAGVRRLVDVRLNNVSQLAAFAKRDDLRYFLRELCQADYVHEPLLAPSQDILDAYKKHKGDWNIYEPAFLQLMADRRIELKLDRESFRTPSVLLCSEATAECCHRRLVLEYLQEKWGDVEIVHL
ncbi:MAG: DUF488 domain-containing protein [Planctomycetota bacterium]